MPSMSQVTESVQLQTPNPTSCAQVPINPVVTPRITTRATRQAQVSPTTSPQIQTECTIAKTSVESTIVSEQIENSSMTIITQEHSTPVVIPRITKASGSFSGEDSIVPVYSRIVTRTKSGIRPRESFTKYASPPRTKTHVEELTTYASPTRIK